MITLYKFGPQFSGHPQDSSPFVIKVMMSACGLPGCRISEAQGNPFKGPHRFLPYIVDEGQKVADSTLIRFHPEKEIWHRFRPRPGCNGQRAVAWAVERMCEDHLYFAMLDMRWMDSNN